MCVVGNEEMKKCQDMINKLQTVTCKSVILQYLFIWVFLVEFPIMNTSKVSSNNQIGRS